MKEKICAILILLFLSCAEGNITTIEENLISITATTTRTRVAKNARGYYIIATNIPPFEFYATDVRFLIDSKIDSPKVILKVYGRLSSSSLYDSQISVVFPSMEMLKDTIKNGYETETEMSINLKGNNNTAIQTQTKTNNSVCFISSLMN